METLLLGAVYEEWVVGSSHPAPDIFIILYNRIMGQPSVYNNSSLTNLNLYNNKIGDVGAVAIGDALKVGSTRNQNIALSIELQYRFQYVFAY